MKNENIKLIILFSAAMAFQIWIMNQMAAHKNEEKKMIESGFKIFPSDQELNNIEKNMNYAK